MESKDKPMIEHRARGVSVRGQVGPEDAEALVWRARLRQLDDRRARLRLLFGGKRG